MCLDRNIDYKTREVRIRGKPRASRRADPCPRGAKPYKFRPYAETLKP